MPLHSSKRHKERVLTFGASGTGKTRSWLSIADMVYKTKGAQKFYVIDTDNAVETMLEEGFPHLLESGIINWKLAFSWEDWTEATKEYGALIKEDDWFVTDMIAPGWDFVQDWFSRQVFKKGLEDLLIQGRLGLTKGERFDGWRDWPTINAQWRSFAVRFLTEEAAKKRFNLFCTSGVAPIGDNDDKIIKATFGPHGVKPKGQKDLPHLFNSCFLLTAKRPGEHYITTCKDRERDSITQAPLGSFVTDYLVKVAGWRLA